jgi:hypothetical protein
VQGKLAITTAYDRKFLAWIGLRPAARARNGLQAGLVHARQVGSQTLIRLYVLHESCRIFPFCVAGSETGWAFIYRGTLRRGPTAAVTNICLSICVNRRQNRPRRRILPLKGGTYE